MTAPYRTAETPDDSAERAELAAFERKVTVLPRWLRVTSESRSHDLLFLAVTIQLAVMLVSAASPLREALVLPTVTMAIPSLLVLAARIRERRRRR